MKEVKAKGINFLFTKQFIIGKYGEQIWEKAIQALPKEEAEICRNATLATENYPFYAYKSLISALSDELGKLQDAELALIYEYIAGQSLNKLYKFFFKFSNPSFVIKNYPSINLQQI